MARVKLKPMIFEMQVEAVINNRETNAKGWRMLRIGGVILESNFLEEGSRFCFPLVGKPIKYRVHIDDKIRVTMFCAKNPTKNNTEESLIAHGAKYELWNDVTDSWDCIYERFDTDQVDT